MLSSFILNLTHVKTYKRTAMFHPGMPTADKNWFCRINSKSCRWAATTICPAPLLPPWAPKCLTWPSRLNVASVSHGQHVPMPTAAAAWCANTAVSKVAWWSWPFDLESGVRVTCDVGYLCANFGLPGPLCSQLRPNLRDRRLLDVRQNHCLMPPPIRGGA